MSWDDDDKEQIETSSSSSSPIVRKSDGCSRSESCSSHVEINKDGPVPKDHLYLVFVIVLLNGIGVLLPWNMFITIAPDYYVNYWFTWNGTEDSYGTNFMNMLGVVSQIPNFLMGVVSVAAIIKGPLLWRIYGSLLVNCVLVSVVLILVIFVSPSPGAEQWFFIVSLIIVMLMNASNGMYQNSVFGLAADFPATYINALVVGNNICGTFTSVLSIVTKLAFPDDTKTVAIIYFSISLATLILCIFSLVSAKKLSFYKYYVAIGDRARALDKSTRPSIKQYLETLKLCWVQCLNVFTVYFVTLSIFPSVLVGIEHEHKQGKTLENLYYDLTVFLNFNLFAAVGSTLASYIQIPPPKLLCIPVFLRLLFIPFFMFCNYLPSSRKLPVAFESAWFYIIGNTVMAITSGYFSSLGMMYAPRNAPSHLQKIAGQLSALALVGGIMAGSGFAYAIKGIVEI